MTGPRSETLLADLVACIGFYTRLPVPTRDGDRRSFAAAQWAAPVAGVVIGLCIGVVLWLALALGAPAAIAAAAALAAGVVLTGALHEDGLADVADGFGGGRDREAKLAIMKDSRIGSYGALALMLSLLTRWAALVALSTLPSFTLVLALVATHAASRSLIPALMMRVAPARANGLSAGAGTVEAETALIAGGIGAVALLLCGFWFALVTIALLMGLLLLVEKLALRQIGGQTGDVLGALQQGGEILILAIAATQLAA